MPHKLETICHEIAEELRDVAGWMSGGVMNPEQFRAAVAGFEARKLAINGLTLSSAVSARGIVHFSLRHADTGELCASLDVNPKTGKSEMQHTTA